MPSLDVGIQVPYKCFGEQAWNKFDRPKAYMPSVKELSEDPEIGEKVSQEELSNIYYPLIQFLYENFKSTQHLKQCRNRFLNREEDRPSPFLIGLAGSVGVGKSTTTHLIKILLKQLPDMRVDLISTDNFLYSNDDLAEKGLMDEKGFPVSYNVPRLLDFLGKIHRNETASTPIYSHAVSDIIDEALQIIHEPDIVILEGLNILQSNRSGRHDHIFAVSDYLDFSLYLDAPTEQIERWYIQRFQDNVLKAKKSGNGHYVKYVGYPSEAIAIVASLIWKYVNLRNLKRNILPTKYRADCILEKGADHRIRKVYIRDTL